MSIKFIDSFLDIYIKRELIDNINFKNKADLEKYLKNLFKILKSKYEITIEGLYDITVYIDKYYGVLFRLEKEDIEYYDYFKNQVDMRIVTVDTEFLYLVDDIPGEIINKIKIITRDGDIFIKIKNKLNKLEMMELLENSRIVLEE